MNLQGFGKSAPSSLDLEYEISSSDSSRPGDPVVQHLTASILSSADRFDRASELLRQHIHSALTVYRCAGRESRPGISRRGQLAPWQVRRATEMLRAHIDKAIPLHELARACSLSVSHFNRAFRQTTGQPPHQWLMTERIGVAVSLLNDGTLSLTEIAHRCGFSDQAAFTRNFKRRKGMAPGQFRRSAA